MSDLLLGELKDEKFDPRELADRLSGFEPADGAVALEILPADRGGNVAPRRARARTRVDCKDGSEGGVERPFGDGAG
jgi:hypothetical protein